MPTRYVALDTSSRKVVEVQVLSWAPIKKNTMEIPAYVVLRVVSLTLLVIGLSLALLAIVILTSKTNSSAQHREVILSLGSTR